MEIGKAKLWIMPMLKVGKLIISCFPVVSGETLKSRIWMKIVKSKSALQSKYLPFYLNKSLHWNEISWDLKLGYVHDEKT